MTDPTDLEEPPRWSRKGRRMRGFEATSGLLKDRIRTAGESRGFAVTRLLTQTPQREEQRLHGER